MNYLGGRPTNFNHLHDSLIWVFTFQVFYNVVILYFHNIENTDTVLTVHEYKMRTDEHEKKTLQFLFYDLVLALCTKYVVPCHGC